MTTEQIKYAIENKRLKLSFWQTVGHFAGIIFFFSIFPIAFIIFLILIIQQDLLSNLAFLFFLLFLLAFSFVGFWFYILLQDNLNFKSASTTFLSEDEIYNIIKKLGRELEWSFPEEFESQIADIANSSVIITETNPGFSFRSGEQITIILNNNTILVNSICVPSKKTSFASMLMNKKNVNMLIEKIEIANAKNMPLKSN